MKYSCNTIRDLMPLCADKAASEESEKALIEHLAECKECVGYWEKMREDLSFGEESGETGKEAKNYRGIVKRLRVKKRIFAIAVGLAVGLTSGAACFAAGSYVIDGYRSTPEKALVQKQNNIGVVNEKIGEYEWNNVKFYFYTNKLYSSCYGVEKSWIGWRHTVTYLSDIPDYDEGIVNHMRGTINYGDDTASVCMLPLSVYDERVNKITLNVGNDEYNADVYAGYTGVLSYEGADGAFLGGEAYDKEGNLLYRLDMSDEFDMKWVKVG